MKTYSSGDIAPPFMSSALDGGECSASRPGRFIPRERASGTDWTGGWVGPQSQVGRCEEKNLANLGNRIPAVRPVVRRYTD
jgi:hypothetical protein